MKKLRKERLETSAIIYAVDKLFLQVKAIREEMLAGCSFNEACNVCTTWYFGCSISAFLVAPVCNIIIHELSFFSQLGDTDMSGVFRYTHRPNHIVALWAYTL